MFPMDVCFPFQISLFIMILALFTFQINNDLDLNQHYFININAIENNNNQTNRYNVSDTSEYFEENNISINETKNSQIKNTKNEVNFSGVEAFQKNRNDDKEVSSKTFNASSSIPANASSSIPANASSNFNFVAVGDWGCSSNAEDTVENIIDINPELVIALGDLSYNDKETECWFELIEPIAERTKIAIGNHELDTSKKLRDYMDFFGLEKQYYSFNYSNIHFIVLSTEIPYDEDSDQHEFVIRDLEKYSNDSSIDWIVALFHRQFYNFAEGANHDEEFRKVYHPLFDKYKVDVALQAHIHAYERTYPINFNIVIEDQPIIQDKHPNIYQNPNGPIFVTVGTGGAYAMSLSNEESYSAIAIDGKFGIMDIDVENNQNGSKILKGKFIENGKDKNILDEFRILKTTNE